MAESTTAAAPVQVDAASDQVLYVRVLSARRLELKESDSHEYLCRLSVGKHSAWVGGAGMEVFETSTQKAITEWPFAPIPANPEDESSAPDDLTPARMVNVLHWADQFTIPVALDSFPKKLLRVKVQRKGFAWTKESLGKVSLNLSSLIARYPVDRWFPLRDDGEADASGEVRLQLLLFNKDEFDERFPDGVVPEKVFLDVPSHPVTFGCCCVHCDPTLVDAFDRAIFEKQELMAGVVFGIVNYGLMCGMDDIL